MSLQSPQKAELICGNSLDVLKTLPSESVQAIITSPPFYHQRNYQNDNQIGQEKYWYDYLTKLTNIFRECNRILKREGSFWLNIADSYNSKTGSLFGIPQWLYVRLIAEGWIARNEIIYHKRNPMPSSAKNRFTIDFEHFYWFTKIGSKYKFNTQYEPMVYQYKNLKYDGKATKDYENNMAQNPSNTKRRILESYRKQAIKFGGNKYPNNIDNPTYSGNVWKPNEQLQRIKRTTWTLTVKPLPKEYRHYAAFNPDLLITPILACSDENDLIIDPFTGASTTGVVALNNNRRFIGIDLNKEYIELSKNRLLKSCNLLPSELCLRTLE